jgi:hypothetical protein
MKTTNDHSFVTHGPVKMRRVKGIPFSTLYEMHRQLRVKIFYP